ncbi:hypothetical protein [Kordia zhangzhouensis]|uniref:hypothetical protein n=1 Tax=Kordia zhangzhouensis TaxID=1620405 RepID=UPI000629B329|nr:hypothetical protein [Kordia zhangzhouensis]
MKYKFTNKCYGWEGHFGVNYESLLEEERALDDISWQGWISKEVQEIIHNSMKLKINEKFDYQVEGSDFYILVEKRK